MNCQPRVFSALARHGPRAPASAARRAAMAVRTAIGTWRFTACPYPTTYISTRSRLPHSRRARPRPALLALAPTPVVAWPSRSHCRANGHAYWTARHNFPMPVWTLQWSRFPARDDRGLRAWHAASSFPGLRGSRCRPSHPSGPTARKRIFKQSDTVTSPIIRAVPGASGMVVVPARSSIFRPATAMVAVDIASRGNICGM